MDAFAVAICKGLGMKRVNVAHALVIAVFFGGFQALMPFIGWALGSQLTAFVEPVAPWVAFALLAAIGSKMVWDAFHEEDDDVQAMEDVLDYRELFMLAVATSIDALAVGVSFAFLHTNIAIACGVIGVTTFAISLGGVFIGNLFGTRWEKPSTIAGGVVLVLLGIKILVEHL